MFEKVSSERMNREKSDICLQTFANISHMKLGYPEIVIFGRDTNCGIIYGRKSLTANLNKWFCKFPVIFSSLNTNCCSVLDLRNFQEQVKKAFCFKNCTDISLFE